MEDFCFPAPAFGPPRTQQMSLNLGPLSFLFVLPASYNQITTVIFPWGKALFQAMACPLPAPLANALEEEDNCDGQLSLARTLPFLKLEFTSS